MKNVLKVALGQTAILTIILSTSAFASSNNNVNRIYGSNRYETSINIANNFNSETVQNVIVASGDNFPDALAGSVLSKYLDAPILLVDKSLNGSKDSINYIKNHLNINGTVYVLGGSASVNNEYADYIKSLGFNNVKRLGGKNRFDTNRVIVESMNVQKGTPVVIVNGSNFPDALSISSIASQKGYPIMLSNANELSEEIKAKVSEIQPSTVYLIGGQSALRDNIINEAKNLIPNIENEKIVRIWGQNRYETSLNICKYFNLDTDTVVIANGENFPDALSGSALAAKLQAPILLTNGKDISRQKEYLDSKNYINKIMLGGYGAIGEDSESALKGIEKKVFRVNNEYTEDGKYYIEGYYSKWVSDIDEALDYERRTGNRIVDTYDGEYYIANDGFDMPISGNVKLEVHESAEISNIDFIDGDIVQVKTNFMDLMNSQYGDSGIFDLVIKDGIVIKMDQEYRP